MTLAYADTTDATEDLVLGLGTDGAGVVENDVRITVLGVRGQQVRVGVDAPKSVTVHREEIYTRIPNDQPVKAAAASRHPVMAEAEVDEESRGNC